MHELYTPFACSLLFLLLLLLFTLAFFLACLPDAPPLHVVAQPRCGDLQCSGIMVSSLLSVKNQQPYQHHRDHLPHRQMVISIVNVFAIIDAVIVRAVVLLNIAAVGAIFIIVADLVDVILSSRMSEQRHRAYLHQRLMQTIIGIEDAIIEVVIGRAAFPRIMCFAKQVAGGRVGCLREQWR